MRIYYAVFFPYGWPYYSREWSTYQLCVNYPNKGKRLASANIYTVYNTEGLVWMTQSSDQINNLSTIITCQRFTIS